MAAVRPVFERTLLVHRYNNRTYRIDDINFDARPTDTFQLRDGSRITFVEYFQRVMLLLHVSPFHLLSSLLYCHLVLCLGSN